MHFYIITFFLLLFSTGAFASGQIIPNATNQFVDSNGNPLAGGFVFMYVPGTTTSKNTWQDPNLTVLNTNPIVLDANGQARIWAGGGSQFRQVVQDSSGNLVWDQITYASGSVSGPDSSTIGNAVIWTNNTGTAIGDAGAPPALRVPTLTALRALTAGVTDNVVRTGFNASGDSPSIFYTWQSSCVGTPDNLALYVRPNSGGSGCWAAALDDPNVWIADSWGADPTGVANSSTAIQAMFTALNGYGGNINFPGKYLLTSAISYTITQAYSKLTIGGGGILTWNNASGGLTIVVDTPESVNSTCYTASIDIGTIDIVTTFANGGTGLTLRRDSDCHGAASAPSSNIAARVRGDYETTYWTQAVLIDKMSNVNFTGMIHGRASALFAGPGPAGLGLKFVGESGMNSCCLNLNGAFITGTTHGFWMSNYTEGVTVNYTNITALRDGCGVLISAIQGIQINIVNSQIGLIQGSGVGGVCVFDQPVSNLNIYGNLFVNMAGNSPIYIAQNLTTSTITNNQFQPFDLTAVSAIYLATTGGDYIVINNNNFAIVGRGVELINAGTLADMSGGNYLSGGGSPLLVVNTGGSFGLKMPVVTDVRQFNAKCDGTTNDATAFVSANSLRGMNKIGVFGTCRISTNNVTLQRPLYFGQIGAISVDAALTFTLNKADIDNDAPFPGAGTVVGNNMIRSNLPTSCVGQPDGMVWKDTGSANTLKTCP